MPVYLDPAGSYVSGYLRGQQANMQRQQFITSQVSTWLGLQDRYDFTTDVDIGDLLSQDPFLRREQQALDSLIRVRLSRRRAGGVAGGTAGGGQAGQQAGQQAFGAVDYASQGRNLLASLLGGQVPEQPVDAAPEQQAQQEQYTYPQAPAAPQRPTRTQPPGYDFGPAMRAWPAAPESPGVQHPATVPAPTMPTYTPAPVDGLGRTAPPSAGQPPAPRGPGAVPTRAAWWVNQAIADEGAYVYPDPVMSDSFYDMLDGE